METVNEDKDCGEALNLGNRIGMKRVNDKEEDLRAKKIRVFEEFDEYSKALKEMSIKEVEDNRGLSAKEASCSVKFSSFGNVDDVKKDGKIMLNFDLNVDDVEIDGKGLDFDLNMPAFVVEECNNGIIPGKRLEGIDILSGESDDEEVERVDGKDNVVKVKQYENGGYYESFESLGLGLRNMGGGLDVSGSSSVNGGRRYSSAEKGKAKIDDSWLSLGMDSSAFDLQPEEMEFVEVINAREYDRKWRIWELEERKARASRHRAETVRPREVLRLTAGRFARCDSKQEDHSEETLSQGEKETDGYIGCPPGPFSTAVKMVRD